MRTWCKEVGQILLVVAAITIICIGFACSLYGDETGHWPVPDAFLSAKMPTPAFEITVDEGPAGKLAIPLPEPKAKPQPIAVQTEPTPAYCPSGTCGRVLPPPAAKPQQSVLVKPAPSVGSSCPGGNCQRPSSTRRGWFRWRR